MVIRIPKNVEYIINTINKNGHEAYIVGGCVRDSVMKIAPKDWDITTSAKPEEIKEMFDKTFDTGIQHGTVTVVINKENFEITTYRIDGEYEDNRRPKEVVFTKNLIEDLKRRDFNMNAMAYHPEEGIIDPFDGMNDIENKIVSCVGKPDERFNEDGLRMLRAIRFSAQLGFDIDKETFESIKRNAGLIENISYERIRDEVSKTLVSDNPMKFLYINEVGIMDIIMPEFVDALNTKQCHEYHCYDVGMHTIHAVDSIEKDFILRWTMLFHDLGKVKTLKIKNGITHFYDHSIKSVEIADSIMKRFRFDNKSINKIKKFVKYHEERPELTEYGIRVLASKVGKDDFENFIKVQKADGMAKSDMKKEEVMFYEIEVKNIFEKIVREGHCIDRKQLAINGKDLQTLGVKQGKEIGKLLELLFEEVLKYPEINKTEILKGKVKEMLND